MANALLNGSVIKIVPGLSPVAIAAAGSGAAFNAAGFEGGMVIVNAGSTPTGAGFLVSVLRSGTSNGAYNGFGCSLPGQGTNGKIVTRSFAVNTSAVWHKVFYDNSNLGSAIVGVEVLLHNSRYEPVLSQDSSVTTYSDVVRG